MSRLLEGHNFRALALAWFACFHECRLLEAFYFVAVVLASTVTLKQGCFIFNLELLINKLVTVP